MISDILCVKIIICTAVSEEKIFRKAYSTDDGLSHVCS